MWRTEYTYSKCHLRKSSRGKKQSGLTRQTYSRPLTHYSRPACAVMNASGKPSTSQFSDLTHCRVGHQKTMPLGKSGTLDLRFSGRWPFLGGFPRSDSRCPKVGHCLGPHPNSLPRLQAQHTQVVPRYPAPSYTIHPPPIPEG